MRLLTGNRLTWNQEHKDLRLSLIADRSPRRSQRQPGISFGSGARADVLGSFQHAPPLLLRVRLGLALLDFSWGPPLFAWGGDQETDRARVVLRAIDGAFALCRGGAATGGDERCTAAERALVG